MKPGAELIRLASGEGVTVSNERLDSFLSAATEHRVLGLVRDGLDAGRLRVGDEAGVRASLVAQELRCETRLRAYTTSANRVVETLTAAGCEVMVMKGWWSMYRLYDRPTDRVTSDVDLLLHPSWHDRRLDLREVFGPSAFEQLGGPSTPEQLSSWTFADLGVDIDLHANPVTLHPPLPGEVEPTIWEQHTVDGGEHWAGARAPTLELALMQALVNYCKDRYMKLFQMEDVRRLITHPETDWDAFHDLVDLAGVRRITDASLVAVTRTLNLPRPPGVHRASPMMLPWTGRASVLAGKGSRVTAILSPSLAALSYDSWSAAFRTIRHRIVPDRSILGCHLRWHGIPENVGYYSGLIKLSARRCRRLFHSRPRPAEVPKGPVSPSLR